ncbi:bacteriohemerythrin [Elongatibacter sediminis]|uniref:Bacteriohemerythrin n=1 Tax=Elongatibacter sediminis TaxID=3119006 RepID=A0AAW9RMN1_9GAMM
MALIDWKPEYEVGVPAVDAEHRAMIEMINDVYRELEGTPDPDTIEHALGEIHSGIAAHFALEEQMMRRVGWREYEEHKANHEELLDDMRDLMDVHAANPEQGREELQRRLADWFTVHFASFDARLHAAFPDSHHH